MRFRSAMMGLVEAVALALVLAVAAPLSGSAAERSFPFDKELRLEASPMRGSKRVPILDIRPNGDAAIGLWCNSVQGQLVVVDDTITVLTGEKTERQCPPERARGDDDILAALTQVTNWRRDGDTLILIGPRTLRFRLQTN
jgi:heat shock protein HslJ